LHSEIFGWSGMSRCAATPLIVAWSPGHSDITRFCWWSPIAPDRKSFGSRRKNSKFAQTTSTVYVFDELSGISEPNSRRASACPSLQEWWTQPAHVRCPVAQLLIVQSARLTTPETMYKQNILCCRITSSPHMNTHILIQWF
jgi:hypothetical protein